LIVCAKRPKLHLHEHGQRDDRDGLCWILSRIERLLKAGFHRGKKIDRHITDLDGNSCPMRKHETRSLERLEPYEEIDVLRVARRTMRSDRKSADDGVTDAKLAKPPGRFLRCGHDRLRNGGECTVE
jgi:hypothetical protein